MFLDNDKTFFDELNIVKENDSFLVNSMLKYEKKYGINSIDLYLKKEKYINEISKNNDFKDWIKKIEQFILCKGNLELINKIKKIDIFSITGAKTSEINKQLSKINGEIFCVNGNNENIERIVCYLTEYNTNFLYIFLEKEKKKSFLKYANKKNIQLIYCKNNLDNEISKKTNKKISLN